ncbi:protein FAR-RED IMPAIRED RESPONSE 1-like isoform X2 [Asparagus officinalis]|uniref:protein FAR-RED IMPAIRED RESPONSE 1-like isoform X2 n=1 Tax=Asparagus officinalis TaxID=4686 RepID=UPI00098E713F|nr:protein FAR-RED IMPAIRED RESPONSE 1-like isoform X2 [Asparagus officinalis]
MSTSQRSESINSFFDKYVNKMTVLKGFIEKYVMALEDSEEAERHANFNTWHKEPAVKTPSLFERQMSGIYTHELFKKFQVEVLGVSGCHATKEKDGVVAIYRVEDFEKEEDFYVSWDANEKIVSCLCRSYEYNGFLCRHSLCVLHHCGIFHVPSHYILERWTRDFIGNGEKRKVVDCRQDRYDDLFRQATMLCEEGSNSQESYNIASHALRVALEKCKMYNPNTNKEGTNCVDGGTPILDTEVVKTKGAKRIKSGTDKKCKEKNNKDTKKAV